MSMCCMCMSCDTHTPGHPSVAWSDLVLAETLPVAPVQLKWPGIGRNTPSCPSAAEVAWYCKCKHTRNRSELQPYYHVLCVCFTKDQHSWLPQCSWNTCWNTCCTCIGWVVTTSRPEGCSYSLGGLVQWYCHVHVPYSEKFLRGAKFRVFRW